MNFYKLKFGKSYYYKPLDCLACFSLNPYIGNNEFYFKVYTCTDLKKTHIILNKEDIDRHLYEVDTDTIETLQQLLDD